MKTNELINRLSENNHVLITSEEYIKVPITDYKVSTVGVDTKYLNLCEDCPQDVAKLLFEYYLTPLEEREAKYKLRTSLAIIELRELRRAVICKDKNLDNIYFLSNMYEDDLNGIQTSFTQKEIDDMPFDTNFFIKEEVQ